MRTAVKPNRVGQTKSPRGSKSKSIAEFLSVNFVGSDTEGKKAIVKSLKSKGVTSKDVDNYFRRRNQNSQNAISTELPVENGRAQRTLKSRNAKSVKKLSVDAPVKMSVEMPHAGIELKLTNGIGMVGTLNVDSTGIVFKRPSAKKDGLKITWSTLLAISDIGLCASNENQNNV